ncbi:MAG: MnmC family methyltransferase [Crinalium sp.]
MQNLDLFTPQQTADGSFTFFSTEFGQEFHSRHGAIQEAQFKFVEPTQLRQKAQQPSITILDVCYGLGYNTAAALATIWEVNPSCRVEWVGLELDSTVPKAAIAHHLLSNWSDPIPQILTQLANNYQLETEQIHAQLLIGDARKTLQHCLNLGFQAEAIFLDPFSPPTCPGLWTVEFMGLLASCCAPTGIIATYSCSAAVRAAMMAVGLNISSSAPVGRRSPGTIASFTATEKPISLQEQEHLQTRAAIPYRDPKLDDTATVILHRRKIEQLASLLEPTSHWKKRWLARFPA